MQIRLLPSGRRSDISPRSPLESLVGPTAYTSAGAFQHATSGVYRPLLRVEVGATGPLNCSLRAIRNVKENHFAAFMAAWLGMHSDQLSLRNVLVLATEGS